MTSYTYLGYGTTGSDGVAKLDHDANGDPINHSYTGSGVGEVDVVASLDKPIVSGSVVSQPSSVLDCIFYDDGIVNPNTKWDCNQVTRSEETNGTKFLVTTTSAISRASMNPLDNSSAYDFDAIPLAFEFDLVDYSASGALQAQILQTSPSTINKAYSLKNSSYIGKTIKIEYTGTALKLYVDGVYQSDKDMAVTYDSNNKLRIGFAFGTQNDYLIVKNVKAYPI